VTVISPYAKAHFVSHVVNDHTSILRFIETRFKLPALTRRDAAANPMLEFFNFKSAAFATPPSLPQATIDPAQEAACATMPSNTGF
jgi:phospholipase C